MPSFLHAADLHVDSPLRGLDVTSQGLGERLRQATRRALQKLVEKALELQVAFMVLSGDLFDSAHQSVETSFFIGDELRRLTAKRIPVFIVRGNHDFLGARSSTFWPDGVHELSAAAPESFPLDELKVMIHGQSFPEQHVARDLSAGYPPPRAGWLNVGLLHTALEGHAGGHQSYAPTSLASLAARGYAYWALGHVHEFAEYAAGDARVVYPGNLQGRNVRETGAKGAVVVDWEGTRITGIRRVFCDVVRWHVVEVSLEPDADLTTQLAETASQVKEATRRDREDGCACAIRIGLRGLCLEGRQLPPRTLRERLLPALRDVSDELLLEELHVRDGSAAKLPATLAKPLDAAFETLLASRGGEVRTFAQKLWERLADLDQEAREKIFERLEVNSAEELGRRTLELGRDRLDSKLARR